MNGPASQRRAFCFAARPAVRRGVGAARLALIAAALLGPGCTVEPPAPPGPSATPVALSEHALAGRIWSPAATRFVSVDDVGRALAAADYVLLGEKHDNAEHHRIQATLLGQVAAAGRRPAVVFEMLTDGQQGAIDAHLAAHPGDSAGLGPAVGWEKTGWPDWSLYEPIAAVALRSDGRLLAGGLDRESIRGVGRDGVEHLGGERVRLLRLDEPVDAAMRAGMRDIIDRSHCAQLPDSMLDPMVSVTLAKDAAMADALIRGAGSGGRGGAVLIAGNGHVRTDNGVPWHVRKRVPAASMVAVGVLEVVDGRSDPAAYAAPLGGERLPFDFVWFTARVDDSDPCEVFAEQLRRARERHTDPAGTAGD